MPRYEFVGGPWDGEFKTIHEGNEVHIVLDRIPGAATIVDEQGLHNEPRIGVYRRTRRRDAPPHGYFKWMGER